MGLELCQLLGRPTASKIKIDCLTDLHTKKVCCRYAPGSPIFPRTIVGLARQRRWQRSALSIGSCAACSIDGRLRTSFLGVHLIAASDHGHVTVHARADLFETLEAAGLRPGTGGRIDATSYLVKSEQFTSPSHRTKLSAAQ